MFVPLFPFVTSKSFDLSSLTRRSQLNVTISTTIRLNSEIYCIRNNGGWEYCPHGSSVNDLVLAVEKLAWQS